MCLPDLLASATNHPVVLDQPSILEDNWEVPIIGSPLGANHASCSKTRHAAVNGADSYEAPMVPLDNVCGSRPPHILPPPMGAGPIYPGLLGSTGAGVGQWTPALPDVAGLPHLQHYTMVYSMRSHQQQPRDRTGHGQATTEQT